MGASQLSTACQRPEVVPDDDEQTSRLGYQDAGEVGPHRGAPSNDGGGELVGAADDNLPQAQPGSGDCGRGRGCEGGRSPGDHGEDVPCAPPTATKADDAHEAGQPGDGPYCDDSERLARSNEGLPLNRSSGDGFWQGQGCSGGRSTRQPGTEMPRDAPAAANASGSREADQPRDGPYCDDSERLTRSNYGLPRTLSSGEGCWRGQGCSGGRSTRDLGMEVPCDPLAATHAGGSREAGRPSDGPYCDDGERLARSHDGPPSDPVQ